MSWIDLSNTTFLKFCHTLIGNREICVARSLFEVICVREGELYIADNFFQLSGVNEITICHTVNHTKTNYARVAAS